MHCPSYFQPYRQCSSTIVIRSPWHLRTTTSTKHLCNHSKAFTPTLQLLRDRPQLQRVWRSVQGTAEKFWREVARRDRDCVSHTNRFPPPWRNKSTRSILEFPLAERARHIFKLTSSFGSFVNKSCSSGRILWNILSLLRSRAIPQSRTSIYSENHDIEDHIAPDPTTFISRLCMRS
jgi:hypothetical protein